jgi:hypothetical protein
VALLVGGTIVIPHLRHAAQSLDYLFSTEGSASPAPLE